MTMTEPASRKASEPPASRVEPPVPVAEIELVKRARRGDLIAYDDLVRRYQ